MPGRTCADGYLVVRIIELDMKADTDSRTEQLKSPFEKGGFRGISNGYKIPPNPPLRKGGEDQLFQGHVNCETLYWVRPYNRCLNYATL